MFRRGLEVRAAGTTTLTVNQTITYITKTSTVFLPGPTVYATITRTGAGRQATTLKPATSTILSTSFATSTAFSTIRGEVHTITSLATKNEATTITQPASTLTSTIRSTSVSVLTEAGTTSTSYKIVSSTSYITLPVVTSTVVNDAIRVMTLITTLPASTKTIFKTQTGKAVTSSTTLPAAVSTKTTTVRCGLYCLAVNFFSQSFLLAGGLIFFSKRRLEHAAGLERLRSKV
jgi:hypothetical protein